MSIHPFPARMAPELARDALRTVPPGGQVLDPMCGSGTVLRAAVEAGLGCKGVDVDPLAVMMSRVWTTPLNPDDLLSKAEQVASRAKALAPDAVQHPSDLDTQRFVAYWFAAPQADALARLTTVLAARDAPVPQALLIALSRTVITKEMMASLARDTSHSRPHRVADKNDFDVYAGFLRSVRVVARRLRPERIAGEARIRLGDARVLHGIDNGTFDLVLTSPPYLNAIDYIRGHRLFLVWLGHAMSSLRRTRASSVGSERGLTPAAHAVDLSPFLSHGENTTFGRRQLGWIRRYASDMEAVLKQIHRTVKRTGRVVLVLGNSFLRGTVVDNAALIESLAVSGGFEVQGRRTRAIPARRRYLPPPGSSQTALATRMRMETVLTLRPQCSIE